MFESVVSKLGAEPLGISLIVYIDGAQLLAVPSGTGGVAHVPDTHERLALRSTTSL